MWRNRVEEVLRERDNLPVTTVRLRILLLRPTWSPHGDMTRKRLHDPVWLLGNYGNSSCRSQFPRIVGGVNFFMSPMDSVMTVDRRWVCSVGVNSLNAESIWWTGSSLDVSLGRNLGLGCRGSIDKISSELDESIRCFVLLWRLPPVVLFSWFTGDEKLSKKRPGLKMISPSW